MTQDERRRFLIGALLAEQPQYRDTALPEDKQAQRLLLRHCSTCVRRLRPARIF